MTDALPLPETAGRPGRAGIRARWAALPGNLKGAAILVFAYFLFTFEIIAARMLGATMATEQVVLVRSAAQLLVVIPFVVRSGLGFGILRTSHLGLHVLRGTLSVVGLYFYFYSFGHLPLANATTISFTKALFLVLLAQMVLGEVVRAPRWIATLVGFGGVMLVVRPGLEGFDAAALAGVAGSFTGAGLLLVTKLLARHETPLAIMVYVALITTGASLVPGLIAWRWPTGTELLALGLIGCFGPMGQYFNILAFRAAEASSLAAIDYVRLIFSAAAGFLLFAEIPDGWTVAGAAVIVGSTFFLTRHEARAAALVAAAPAADPLSEPLTDTERTEEKP
ncbi:DMT family transporter [Prosthecomicrobium sp. N25]|uniref:DMT family transporter n=1 Tax=Prosthecomicrobium sp. N25 TaxID=3129254 RepID=UPI0030770337